jgi:hypothetical protein
MASQQAWDDFLYIKATLTQVHESEILVHLKAMLQDRVRGGIYEDIIQDPDRAQAVSQIAAEHPKYTVAYVQAIVAKLIALDNYLVAQGFYSAA